MTQKTNWKRILAILLAIVVVVGVAWYAVSQSQQDQADLEPVATTEAPKEDPAEAPTEPEETEPEATEPEAEETEAEEPAAAEPIVLTDTAGREVTLDGPAETVVSLGPNMTEIMFALGAGERLVARTDYCDYPEAALELPSIGTLMEPNLEAIVELDPDIVIASTHVQEEFIQALEEVDIPVLFLYDEHHVEGMKDVFAILGEALAMEDEAAALTEDVFSRIDAVREAYADADDKPVVYYVVGFGEYGEFTATGETFLGELLEIAGAENAAKDAEGWMFSLEKLLEIDPDYILLPPWAVDDFTSTEPYTELTAVKEDRVIVVDDNEFSRQGPRNADAVEKLAEAIH